MRQKTCVFPTPTSETFLILRRIQRCIITNVDMASSKVSLILLDVKRSLISSTDFRKILKYEF